MNEDYKNLYKHEIQTGKTCLPKNSLLLTTIYLLLFSLSFSLLLTTIYLLLPASADAATISRPLHNAGLVGYWSMDEGAGATAYDKSGNGFNGTLTSMDPATDWVSGKFGGALDFDGTNDRVQVTDDGSFDFGTGNFTLSAWIKGTDTSNYRNIIFHYDTAGYAFLTNITDGVMRLWIGDTALNGNTNVLDNEWHHVAVTRNGANVVMYLDGAVDQTSSAYSGKSATSIEQLCFGYYCNGFYPFNGRIDEVRIYNRALTEGEVKRLYNLGRPKLTKIDNTGLVGYWSFDEQSGTRAEDGSGNGYTGTLGGNMTDTGWVDGRVGNALDFDGSDDHVDISSYISTFGAYSSGTVCFWLNTDATTDNLFSLSDVSTNNNLFRFSLSSDKFSILIKDNAGSDVLRADSSSALGTLNTWKHFCYASDSSGNTLYVDGSNEAMTYTTGNSSTQAFFSHAYTDGFNDRFLIGRSEISAGSSSLDGKIDEVRIYNKALTADEVKTLYEQSKKTVINKTPTNRLTNGLVGHWTFDGNDMGTTSAFDLSGNGNTGWLINGTKKTAGVLGQALDFDGGNDYVEIDSVADDMEGVTAFTWSAWVKTTDSSTPAIFGVNTSTGGNAQSIILVTGKVRYWDDSTFYDGNTAINDGKWHHVVLVVPNTGTSDLIYVDGTTDRAAFNSTNNFESDNQWSIGQEFDNAPTSDHFDGIIDDARIYNRALTPAEVNALYQMGR